MDCIVTQGWGGWPGRRGLGHDTATTWPRHGQEACDTAETMAYNTAETMAYDTTGLCARAAWPGRESRYSAARAAVRFPASCHAA